MIDTTKDYLVPTYTGKAFDLSNPSPDKICLDDIAHSLSQLCRFVGSTHRFYSVAEHSLMVSHLVKPENKHWALMHDAAEAYTGDVISPLKKIIGGGYSDFENRILSVIEQKYTLGDISDEVILADKFATIQEGLYFHSHGELAVFWNTKMSEFIRQYDFGRVWVGLWNRNFNYSGEGSMTRTKQQFLKRCGELGIQD